MSTFSVRLFHDGVGAQMRRFALADGAWHQVQVRAVGKDVVNAMPLASGSDQLSLRPAEMQRDGDGE